MHLWSRRVDVGVRAARGCCARFVPGIIAGSRCLSPDIEHDEFTAVARFVPAIGAHIAQTDESGHSSSSRREELSQITVDHLGLFELRPVRGVVNQMKLNVGNEVDGGFDHR
jgi:hypothetical protein